jgi:hypothetical protein
LVPQPFDSLDDREGGYRHPPPDALLRDVGLCHICGITRDVSGRA